MLSSSCSNPHALFCSNAGVFDGNLQPSGLGLANLHLKVGGEDDLGERELHSNVNTAILPCQCCMHSTFIAAARREAAVSACFYLCCRFLSHLR